MVRLRLGDVCELRRMRHICGMVNRSRALMYPMAKDSHEVKPRFEDETFTVSAYAGPKGITPVVEKEFVLERLGVDGWENFRDSKKRKATDMRLELGDVIGWEGNRATCVAVDGKRARVAWQTVTGGDTDTTGKVTPQSVVLGSVVIARDINEYYLVHRSRLTEHERAAELKNFLAANAAAAGELTKEIGSEETVGATMATKVKKNKAEAKAAGEKKPAGDDLKKIFGFSISSVLNRLGKEGVTTAHAKAIMVAQGKTVKDSSVSTGISDGRSGKYGKPAELTGAQVKELRASAKDPALDEKK